MCSCAHLVYVVHLLALASGLMLTQHAGFARLGARAQLALVAALAVGMSVFMFHVSNPAIAFTDFGKAYWPAGAAVLHGGDGLRTVMSYGAYGFVNLPIMAYLFAPLGALPQADAALAFTLVGLASVLAALLLLIRVAGLDRRQTMMLVVIFATFGPLIYSIREGNASHIVLLLLVVAFLLLRARREVTAGALLGLVALIKLPLMLFGIYYLVRGRWGVLAGGATVMGAALALSLLVFGWDLHVFWYQVCIRPYTHDPVAALNVQSVAAALARLEFGPPAVLDWERRALSPALAALATASTFILLGLAVASAVIRRRPDTNARRSPEIAAEVEFMIVLMLAAVISPLSWSHYYVWMLLPIAFFVGQTAHFGKSRVERATGWVAIIIASPPVLFWQPAQALLSQVHARLGVSHVLVGGLLMLGLLTAARWRLARLAFPYRSAPATIS